MSYQNKEEVSKMGIVYLKDKKLYKVSYSKRHPITRKSVGLTRTHFVNTKGQKVPITSKAQGKRVRDQLILEVEKKLKKQIIPTWEKLLQNFEPHFRSTGVKPKTVETYMLCLRKHTSNWYNKSVDEITKVMIHNLIVSLESHSESHKKNLLKFIRRVFQFALESGFVLQNPTPFRKFKVGSKNLNVLKESEISHLLNSAKSYESEWYFHWLLALYTGMRSGELYALKWENVDFDLEQIQVKESWNSTDGFKSTKSGDERIVPMAPKLIQELKKLKLERGEANFVLPRLNKWDKGEQARELRKFLESIGLHGIRFHDLRATWATQLLSKGVQPVKVMAIGGWKDIKTMMIYIRKAGVDLKGTTDCLDFHNPSENKDNLYSLNFS